MDLIKSHMHVINVLLLNAQPVTFPHAKQKPEAMESLAICVWLQTVHIPSVLSWRGLLPAGAGGCSAKGSCWKGSPMQNRKIIWFIHYLARWWKFEKTSFSGQVVAKVWGHLLPLNGSAPLNGSDLKGSSDWKGSVCSSWLLLVNIKALFLNGSS